MSLRPCYNFLPWLTKPVPPVLKRLRTEEADEEEVRQSILSLPPHYAGDISLLRAGSWTQMMSTELNALSSATAVLQATGTNAAFDNTAAAGTGLFFWSDFELQVTFGTGPTANSLVDLYIIPLSQAGGTTFWDSSLTALPLNLYIGSWPVRSVTTAQIIGIRGVPLPPQKFILLLNNNTNQAFPATGSKVYMFPYGEAYT